MPGSLPRNEALAGSVSKSAGETLPQVPVEEACWGDIVWECSAFGTRLRSFVCERIDLGHDF